MPYVMKLAAIQRRIHAIYKIWKRYPRFAESRFSRYGCDLDPIQYGPETRAAFRMLGRISQKDGFKHLVRRAAFQ